MFTTLWHINSCQMCLEFLGSEIINAFQQRLEAPGLEMGSGRPAILAGHLSASLQRPGDTARQFLRLLWLVRGARELLTSLAA